MQCQAYVPAQDPATPDFPAGNAAEDDEEEKKNDNLNKPSVQDQDPAVKTPEAAAVPANPSAAAAPAIVKKALGGTYVSQQMKSKSKSKLKFDPLEQVVHDGIPTSKTLIQLATDFAVSLDSSLVFAGDMDKFHDSDGNRCSMESLQSAFLAARKGLLWGQEHGYT